MKAEEQETECEREMASDLIELEYCKTHECYMGEDSEKCNISRLFLVLIKYAQHTSDCNAAVLNSKECTCGVREIIKNAKTGVMWD